MRNRPKGKALASRDHHRADPTCDEGPIGGGGGRNRPVGRFPDAPVPIVSVHSGIPPVRPVPRSV